MALSSSGQTVFVEPLETIEQNNELVRLLDEEQAEIHRILVAMTQAIGQSATPIHLGACILAEVEAHSARARFAIALNCTRPAFSIDIPELTLTAARHPLLEIRMRSAHLASGTEGEAPKPVPLTIALPPQTKQLIISGPNTGGKTVSLKTLGLLALMAQAGVPVPAEAATLPLFTSVYADIGDAQSIERNLSSFSAHVVNLDRISREATSDSLVLLDELGSATDPERGRCVGGCDRVRTFSTIDAWCCITTHLTSLKVYAAEPCGGAQCCRRLRPADAYADLRAAARRSWRFRWVEYRGSAWPAQRLLVAAPARAQMTTQTADIGAFLDQLSTINWPRLRLRRDGCSCGSGELSQERTRVEVEGRVERRRARTEEA